ncbi:MAG: 30S ribosomal protein S9 [Bacteroidota bacterium]
MEKIYAKGGRKTATARAFLSKAQGSENNIKVNKKPFEKYFTNPIDQKKLLVPLEVLKGREDINPEERYDIYVTVKGGGTTGQTEAIVHAIACALSALGEPYKSAMKRKKLLTRDPRMTESKKYGLKKARKTEQWVKR